MARSESEQDTLCKLEADKEPWHSPQTSSRSRASRGQAMQSCHGQSQSQRKAFASTFHERRAEKEPNSTKTRHGSRKAPSMAMMASLPMASTPLAGCRVPRGASRPRRTRAWPLAATALCALKEPWRRRKNAPLYRELEGPQGGTAVRRKPEVLAPAGGWPQLRAAVRNGADAVYFGLAAGLNARRRASNFDVQELSEVMAYLKSHEVQLGGP